MTDFAGASLGAGLVQQWRDRLGRSVRWMLSGDPEPRRPSARREDPGLFGPDSATWVVHSDPSMLVGGLRALLYQTLHPLAMSGVAQHSAYKRDPLGRLRRTVGYVGQTTYGTTAEAEQAIERVKLVHRKVRGVAPDGRPYSADDPDLVAWVHCTEVDSFLSAYQTYGRHPLASDEADQYVEEMARLGESLGGAGIPRSTAELAARLDSFRPELAVNRDTLDAVRFLLLPPLPLHVRPTYGVIAAAAVNLLPLHARRRIWIPPTPISERLVVRPAAKAVLGALGWALQPTEERDPSEPHR